MQTTVSIPGIHCASCAAMIKDVSADFPQVKNVTVDTVTKNVTIQHSDDFDLSAWIKEIESLGDTYKVNPISA